MKSSQQVYWTTAPQAAQALLNVYNKLSKANSRPYLHVGDASLYSLERGSGATLAVRVSRSQMDGGSFESITSPNTVASMVLYGENAVLSADYSLVSDLTSVRAAIRSVIGVGSDDLISRLAKKGVPEDRLEVAANILSTGNSKDVAVNTHTGTGCVVRYSTIDADLGPTTMYLKIGKTLDLVKEYVHLQQRRAHSLLRPITVVPHSLEVDNESETAGLITYGVQNQGLIDIKDFQKYAGVCKDLFIEYASSRPLGLAELRENGLAVPIFNASLAQILLQEEKENLLYSLNPRPEVIPFEELMGRAKETSPDVLQQFRALKKPYLQAEERLRDLPEGTKCLVDIDRKQENTYVVSGDFVIGYDFGHVQVSSPAQQLASIGSLKSGEHARFALYCLENLPHVIANRGFNNPLSPITEELGTFSAQANLLAGIRSVRVASAKVSHGMPPNVVGNYLKRAQSHFV